MKVLVHRRTMKIVGLFVSIGSSQPYDGACFLTAEFEGLYMRVWGLP